MLYNHRAIAWKTLMMFGDGAVTTADDLREVARLLANIADRLEAGLGTGRRDVATRPLAQTPQGPLSSPAMENPFVELADRLQAEGADLGTIGLQLVGAARDVEQRITRSRALEEAVRQLHSDIRATLQ